MSWPVMQPQLHAGSQDDVRVMNMLRFISRKALARNHSLRYVFRSYDEDHNGFIDKKEFAQALRHLALEFSPPEVDLLFHRFDRDHSGFVSYDEFARTVTQVDESPYHALDRQVSLDEADERALIDRHGMHMVPKTDIMWLLSQKVELKNSKHMVGRAFREYDEDHNGCISFGEFDRALQGLGFALSNEQLRELFNRFDTDGSGSIDYNEFTRALFPGEGPPAISKGSAELAQDQQYHAYLLRKSDIVAQIAEQATVKGKNFVALRTCFRRWDGDGDGLLSYGEVQKALLEAITYQSTESSLRPLFERCDPQCSGKVDYCQLAAMIDPSHLNQVPVPLSDSAARTLSSAEAMADKSHFSLDVLPKTDLLRCLADKVLMKQQTANVRTLFRPFDSDRDGKLSYEEFDRALRHVGMDLARADLEHLLHRIDTHGRGCIDFDDLADKVERVDGGRPNHNGGTFGSPPKNFGPPSRVWGQTSRPTSRAGQAPFGTSSDYYSTPAQAGRPGSRGIY